MQASLLIAVNAAGAHQAPLGSVRGHAGAIPTPLEPAKEPART